MSGFTVELLGGFRATLAGRSHLHFRTRKTAALLIYLVTEAAMHARGPARPDGFTHDRQALMSLFWPEFDDAAAQNNLRQTLFTLRQATSDVPGRGDQGAAAPLVLSDRSLVWLNPEARYESDVGRFMALLRTYAAGDCEALLNLDAACIETLEAATALYQGDFLAGYALAESQPFQEWALLKEEYLRQQALKALTSLTAAYVRLHDYAHAAAAARRQIRIDELQESAYRQLIGLLALGGHRSDALLLYDRLRQRLRDVLGVNPERTTRRLHQAVLREQVAWPCPVPDGPPQPSRPGLHIRQSEQRWAGVGFSCP